MSSGGGRSAETKIAEPMRGPNRLPRDGELQKPFGDAGAPTAHGLV